MHEQPVPEKLRKDLTILYDALQIPLCLYADNSIMLALPENTAEFYPAFPHYIDRFPDDGSVWLPAIFPGRYARLFFQDYPGLWLVIGPVFSARPDRNDFHRILAEYRIRSVRQDDFSIFLRNIPVHSSGEFAKIIIMINHFLNPDTTIHTDIRPQDLSGQLLLESVRTVYEQTAAEQTNDSLEHEKILTDIVEHGQLEKLASIQLSFFNFRKGTLASTPLRNEKDLNVALITVVTRAAIRGGLESQLALQLSDRYIQKLENCTSRQELSQLMFEVLLDFTTLVSNNQKDHTANGDMNRILTYVRNHTHEPLTTAGIAATFGYNPSYLSSRFKKELGFGLSSFIYRTRLEESRLLLTSTSRSLMEISEYLCFSDQSHFQNKFRKQYGMTPLQYRRLYTP